MPAVSPAQKRLMMAAAHTEGGYGGVPQSVGKEYVGKDEVPDYLMDLLPGLLKADDCMFAGDDAAGWRFMAKDGVLVGPFATRDMAGRALELVENKPKLAMDRAGSKFTRPAGMGYDKISFRVKDVDGRLHLHEKLSHISKACVSPYLGSEIPDFETLGLQADKIYKLLRDPVELEKAAPTFNGIPLMIEHVPTSADDHQPDLIAGTTGTDAVFNAPYLDNSLSIWTADGVEGVESETQMELSCGYRYTPDMTPGSYEGEAYDGVMRNIIGNHVALVEEGRAGPDVVVGDKTIKPEEIDMKVKPLSRTALRFEGVLAAHMLPKLAKDKAPVYFKHIHTGLAKVTRKGLMATDGKTLKKGMLEAVVKMAKDGVEEMLAPEAKAAGGAGPDDVIMKLLEHALEGGAAESPEMDEMVPEQGDPAEGKGKKSLADVLKARGMSDDDISGIESEMGGMDEDDDDEAMDETPEEKEAREKKAADELAGKVDKKAMDAAIKKAVADSKAEMTATQEARDFVRPYVGEISMAHDSAAAVYGATLKSLGIDSNGVKDPAALKAILSVVPKPNGKAVDTPIALDAATTKSLAERFPHATKMV